MLTMAFSSEKHAQDCPYCSDGFTQHYRIVNPWYFHALAVTFISVIIIIIIIIIITRLITRHMSIAVKRRIADADGHPWCSPSQVLATICCACNVFACVLFFLVFIKAVHLGNKITFRPLSPLTSLVKVSLQCHSDHFHPFHPINNIQCTTVHLLGHCHPFYTVYILLNS